MNDKVAETDARRALGTYQSIRRLVLAILVVAMFAALLFVGVGGLEIFGFEPVPFLPPLSLRWSELPWLLTVPAATD